MNRAAQSPQNDQPQSNADQAWLMQRRAATQVLRNARRQSELRWSWARLASFLLIGAALIRPPFAGMGQVPVLVALAAMFLVAVRVHQSWKRRRETADRLLLMMDESASRLGGRVVVIRSATRPTELPEIAALGDILAHGPCWELTAQERDDLDLYAPPVGVFGLLNRASTPIGEARLAHTLEHPLLDTHVLKARQTSVAWLTGNSDVRLRCMAAAAGLRLSDASLLRLIGAVRQCVPLGIRTRSLVLRCLSPVIVLLFIVGMARGLSGSATWGMVSLLSIALGGALFALVRRHTAAALHAWERTAPAADGLLHAATESGDALARGDGEWVTIAAAFRNVLHPTVLPRLCRRLPWNDSGGPMRMLLNALVFHDLWLAESIVTCAITHRASLQDAAAALGELEALCSLACFGWEQPRACMPKFMMDSGTERCLQILNGCHPLIEPAVAVGNSIELNESHRVWLLTGSNMAGKSTFLRMIGINTVLAQVGAACVATAVRMHVHRLMTDLRARDDLSRGESYFLAEVRQLRRMLPAVDGAGAPVLGLIDEPLRGTNSAERVAASVAVVEHLIRGGGFFVIASHEQRLTELSDGRQATNHHFHENLSGSGPTFDYMLRDGAATIRNALRVMRREGYPDELMQRAESLAATTDGDA